MAAKFNPLSYLLSGASRRGIDPAAVAAVVRVESSLNPYAVGDNGTSYGLFQLHEGGALPSGLSGQAAARFAASPQGIDYALDRIAKVAAGLRGPAAVRSIVTGFERPANPEAEIRRALTYYGSPLPSGGVPLPSGGVPPTTGGAPLPQTGQGVPQQRKPSPALLAALLAAAEPSPLPVVAPYPATVPTPRPPLLTQFFQAPIRSLFQPAGYR